ncbi:MAG: hypothetical protein AAFU85_12260 [Planctomycetota bacterium]
MDVDDFQVLYSELRGSRCSKALIDARALFLERQLGESLAKLSEARDIYQESRARVLRQDPEKDIDKKAADRDRQIRRLKRKQEKAREILGRFEEMIPQLQKLAKREAEREAEREAKRRARENGNIDGEARTDQAPADPSPAQNGTRHDSQFLGAQFLEHFGGLTGDRQLSLVSARFGFRPLLEDADVQSDAVYLMHDGHHSHLFIARASSSADEFDCMDPATNESLGPVTRDALVKFSIDRKLVMLVEKA